MASTFQVDCLPTLSGPTPPIPFGLYAAWCMDGWDGNERESGRQLLP